MDGGGISLFALSSVEPYEVVAVDLALSEELCPEWTNVEELLSRTSSPGLFSMTGDMTSGQPA